MATAAAAKFTFPGLIVNEDGSTQRIPSPELEVPPNPEFVAGVASRDVILDTKLDLWVRVFFPEHTNQVGESDHGLPELPVVVYFHGGGFIVASASLSMFHKWCGQICTKLKAVVVSVNYRLAPENRLPAAYDDGFSVLTWLQKIASKQESSALQWFHYCDFSRVFLMGDSAGGNLCHHVAVRAARNWELLQPVKVIAQVLLQPFFMGASRTDSEVRLAQGAVISTEMCDVMWQLSLPESAAGNLDHPFSNPALHLPQVLKDLESFPKTLVVVGDLDLLQDRQQEYAEILKQCGKTAKLVMYKGADHGFYLSDSKETLQLLDEMTTFCLD